MAELTVPDVSVRAYPVTAIPQRVQHGYYHADVFSDLVKRNWGDVVEMLQSINPTLAVDWAAQPEFVSIEGALTFIRFHKDGTFREGATARDGHAAAGDADEDLAGFCLKPRDGFLDYVIGDFDADLDTDFFNQTWEAVQGEWETVKPPDAPQRARICNTGDGLTAKAQTVGEVVAGRSLRFDLNFLGILQDAPLPGVRIGWAGDTYSLVGRHGGVFTVEKKFNGEWFPLANLPGLKVDCRRGNYLIRIRWLNGRLCVSVNQHHFHIIEPDPATVNAPGTQPREVESYWPKGKLTFNCFNCRATLGGALIKYADEADTVYSGVATRTVSRSTFLAGDTTLAGGVTGWAKYGTAATVTAAIFPGQTQYELTLTASKAGVATPFINKVTLSSGPQWEADAPAYLELRPAVRSIEVSRAIPDLSPMATCTIELDRLQLPDGWEDYVAPDCPVEVWIRQRYQDQTVDDWVCLFVGYMYPTDKTTGAYSQADMTLTCFDPLWRLQGLNATIVPTRYPPLDFLLLDAASGVSNPAGLKIYGSDCVKKILELALGPGEADVLNGDGDGQRFFDADHAPLLSTANDTFGLIQIEGLFGHPPSNNGFWFPPPWFEGALDWINDIRTQDGAVFCYMQLEGATDTRPVPAYGRVANLMQYATDYTIPDRDYSGVSIINMLKTATVQINPKSLFNEFFAYSEWGAAGLQGMLPALRMAYARLPADDPNAPERSWGKMRVVKKDLLAYPGAAEFMVQRLAAEFEGRPIMAPRITVRGMPRLQGYDRITVRADGSDSDSTLGLNGVQCRAEQFTHKISLTAETVDYFLTEVSLRPTTNSGL